MLLMAEQLVSCVSPLRFQFCGRALRHSHIRIRYTPKENKRVERHAKIFYWNHKVSRRETVLEIATVVTMHSLVGNVNAEHQSLQDANPRFYETSTGVKIEEIVEGTGPTATEGNTVEFNYVCRRSNGYFVYSTVDQLNGESKPVTLSLNNKQMISGLKEVLLGMKAGGKRRALIPPSAGYVEQNLEPLPEEYGPRRSLLSHIKEPLVFEVQVLKVL